MQCKNCPTYQESLKDETILLWYDADSGSYLVDEDETCEDVNTAYQVTVATDSWLPE
jgi:hypothetical protein